MARINGNILVVLGLICGVAFLTLQLVPLLDHSLEKQDTIPTAFHKKHTPPSKGEIDAFIDDFLSVGQYEEAPSTVRTEQSTGDGKKGPTHERVAVAVTVTGDGYGDAAFVIAESLRAAQSVYEPDLVAIVLPTVKNVELYQQAGFRIIVRDLPVQPEEIQDDWYRNKVVKSGCCGISELSKFHAWTLMEYDRVLHLDMDTLIMKNFDHLLQHNVSLVYAMGNIGGVQGGFLLLKPNITFYEDIRAVVRRGHFNPETGWEKSGLGWYYGGATVQGLLHYYFYSVMPTEARYEVDRCLYAEALTGPNWKAEKDCWKATPVGDEIVIMHFTSCGKPWKCDQQREPRPACRYVTDYWWKMLFVAESQFDLRAVHTDSPLTRAITMPRKIFPEKSDAVVFFHMPGTSSTLLSDHIAWTRGGVPCSAKSHELYPPTRHVASTDSTRSPQPCDAFPSYPALKNAYPDAKLRSFTLLRSPFARVLSEYFALRIAAKHSFGLPVWVCRAVRRSFAARPDMSFEAFVALSDDQSCAFGGMHNRMASMLSGLNPRRDSHHTILERAKKNLVETAAFGLADRMANSSRLVFGQMGWGSANSTKILDSDYEQMTQRQLKGYPEEQTLYLDILRARNAVQQKISEKNALDERLYAYAEEIFERRLERLPC